MISRETNKQTLILLLNFPSLRENSWEHYKPLSYFCNMKTGLFMLENFQHKRVIVTFCGSPDICMTYVSIYQNLFKNFFTCKYYTLLHDFSPLKGVALNLVLIALINLQYIFLCLCMFSFHFGLLYPLFLPSISYQIPSLVTKYLVQ